MHPNAQYARPLAPDGPAESLRRERQLRLAAESANQREDLLGAGKDVLEALIGPLGTWDAAHLIPTDRVHAHHDSPVWAFHHVDGARIFAPLLGLPPQQPEPSDAGGDDQAPAVQWYRLADCARSPLTQAAAQCGVATYVDIPVTAGEEVVAVIRVYSLHDRQRDSDVIATLAAMGTILGRVVERARAVTAKAEASARHVALTQASPLATISVDPAGQVTGWNAAAQDLFGWTDQEMRGQPLDRLFPPELAQRYAAGLAAVGDADPRTIAQATPVMAIRKDGTRVDAEASVGAWHEGSGRHFAIFVQDVADRHRAEAAIRERDAARLSVQHAVELQDNVIQGLVLTKYTLQHGDVDDALGSLETVLDSARRMVGQMMSPLSMDELRAFLMRSRPAAQDTPPTPKN